MRNQQVIKLFLVLMISVTYIFSFSHFGALAYDSVMNKNDQFSEGTMIGSLSIAGKTTNEALQLTDEQLTKWFNETTFTLKYRENSETLDLSYFTFDMESTLQVVKHGQMNEVIVQLEPLEDFLQTLSASLNIEDLLMEDLTTDILQGAKMLEPGNYEIRVDDYFKDGNANELTTIEEFMIDPEYMEKELDLLVGKSIEIAPTTQFSLLKYIKEDIEELSALSLSKLATAIYEVVLPTNFTIIERHIGNEIPSYAELGFEAKADMGLNYDLVFSNPNEYSYFIEFEKKNDSLIITLKGPEFLNRYRIESEGKESFKPKKIIQFNPQLRPDEFKVKIEGKEGQLIKIYREHRSEKGELLKKELISEDFYPPIHQVEVSGLIIGEGDSIITPGTNNDEEDEDDPNTDVTDKNSDQTGNVGDNSNSSPEKKPDSSNSEDDALWGKENEIPK